MLLVFLRVPEQDGPEEGVLVVVLVLAKRELADDELVHADTEGPQEGRTVKTRARNCSNPKNEEKLCERNGQQSAKCNAGVSYHTMAMRYARCGNGSTFCM